MRRLLNCAILWAWLALCLVVSATNAGEPTVRFERLSWRDGLSQATVLTIFQDSRGHVWYGTEDGLNRYDGDSFRVYRHDTADPSSLPNNFVRAIDEDSHGRLWVGTEGGGVARWDPLTDRFVRYRQAAASAAPRLASDYVQALRIGPLGEIWIGTGGAGLHRLDATSGQLTQYRHESGVSSSLSGNSVFALMIGEDGELWIGTEAGLDRFDVSAGAFVHYSTVSGDSADSSELGKVRSLLEDRQGVVWVGTQGDGLGRLDPATGELIAYRHQPGDTSSLRDDHVRALFEDAAGRLWVGTLSGIDLLDRQSGRFSHTGRDRTNPADLGDHAVLSIHEDRDGVVWAGTHLAGIARWDPERSPFAHHKIPAPDAETPKSADIVTSFAQDEDGRIFVGTLNAGLARIDRTSGDVIRFRRQPGVAASLTDDRVMALRRDRRGKLWIGTKDGGLNRLDPASSKFRAFKHDPANPSSLSADGVMSLFEDEKGVLWIGTFGGGLNRFDEASETFVSFRSAADHPNSLPGDRITSVTGAAGGLLWVGTFGAGLSLFDPATGHAHNFQQRAEDPASLPSDTVLSLFRDDAGTLWAGTHGGGLARIDIEPGSTNRVTIKTYTENDGLPNGVIHAIQPDETGALWLSTNQGLSRFDPVRETFTNFDVRHGLQANEFNYGASYRSATGELFFGGINGYNAFYPEQLSQREPVAAAARPASTRQVSAAASATFPIVFASR